MNWYTAKCIFRADVCDSNKKKQLYENRYILVRARDMDEAIKKAQRISKAKEHSYKNQQGQQVSWIFVEVIETKEILAKKISEGVDVYYEYQYKRSLHRSAKKLAKEGNSS